MESPGKFSPDGSRGGRKVPARSGWLGPAARLSSLLLVFLQSSILLQAMKRTFEEPLSVQRDGVLPWRPTRNGGRRPPTAECRHRQE